MCAIVTIKVFIVDRSSIIQERLGHMLAELNGVEIVGQAQNAASAIPAIHERKPDLVIQDVQTANGNGLDLLAAIKLNERPPLVMVMTNDAYPVYRKAYLKAGADFFLDKSSEFDRIPEVLRHLLTEKATLGSGD
jgi:two-component system, NarL family, response regulator DevR